MVLPKVFTSLGCFDLSQTLKQVDGYINATLEGLRVRDQRFFLLPRHSLNPKLNLQRFRHRVRLKRPAGCQSFRRKSSGVFAFGTAFAVFLITAFDIECVTHVITAVFAFDNIDVIGLQISLKASRHSCISVYTNYQSTSRLNLTFGHSQFYSSNY